MIHGQQNVKLRILIGLTANLHVPHFSNDNIYLKLHVILYFKEIEMKRVVILNKL